MRKLTENEPGLWPKFLGIMRSPVSGTRLKFPNGVQRMVDRVQSTFAGAKAGRSFVTRSRFRSCPVVMLKGGPVLATMKGLITTFHHGEFIVPKIVKR